MTPKILFSDNSLWGLLNFRSGIIRYLLESGFAVTLVAPKDAMCNTAFIPPGAKYVPVELSRTGINPWYDYIYYKRLRKIYQDERPDYIFHYTIKPNIYGTFAAKESGIPSTAMIAGVGHVFTHHGLVPGIARMLYKKALSFSQYLLVLNQANADLLIKQNMVSPEKLIWLKGGEGINLKQFEYHQYLPHGKPVFLMIGRLLYEKGYAEYVGVARQLYGQAVFRIMGPIDNHPTAVPAETVRQDSDDKIIEYIPFSDEVQQQIASADCIVLPSFYGEGLSRVLMEACAIGRPIICTDIPGCRETVEDGVNGFLCKPKDTSSLMRACQAFMKLTLNEKIKMAVASRDKAEKVFDEQGVITEYMRIINLVGSSEN